MPFLLTRRAFSLALAGAAVRPNMRWALLSDTHVPADPANVYRGFRPYDNLKKIVPEIVAAKPDGALVCGDLARLEGKAGDYENAKSLLAPVMENTPLAVVLGNHDDRKNFLSVFGADQKGAQKIQNKHVAVIDGPNARLVILDSLLATNQTPGLLGKAQRTWLNGYLQSSSDVPTVLFFHHTLDDNDGSLLDAPRLFDLVKPHRNVKALVFGHSHRYSYDTFEGIHLINLPAVGYNFNDNEPVGWVEASFASGGGEFTLRAFGGSLAKNGKTVSLAWRG